MKILASADHSNEINMLSGQGWDVHRASEIIGQHVGTAGGLLPMLHDLQATFGYIADDGIVAVATALNLTRAEVHGVVSFYHDFRRAPAGRHVLKLCRAEACQATGGDVVADQTIERLGVSWGGTTGDGALTVEPVYCVGLCACAPAALLDGRPIGRLTSAKLQGALDACLA